MLKTLQEALKIKDIRKKLFFTFLMMVIIRIGCQIPVPGVNRDYFAAWFATYGGEAFNFFDAFTGGSFTSMSIFALNVSPYITSSIIIQLLTIAIPKLEEMNKDGMLPPSVSVETTARHLTMLVRGTIFEYLLSSEKFDIIGTSEHLVATYLKGLKQVPENEL